MSGNDNEDLIDYEDEHEMIPNGSSAPSAASGAAASGPGEGEDKDKKNFSGIHSTGFRFVVMLSVFRFFFYSKLSHRDFLLKPELRRAISDLGFEHPSEGKFLVFCIDRVHTFFP